MDSKVRFEVANSNIWLNHLATTTIIQVVLKAQSVKKEEAILGTGSMFDLVYSTNTLYPRPVLI